MPAKGKIKIGPWKIKVKDYFRGFAYLYYAFVASDIFQGTEIDIPFLGHFLHTVFAGRVRVEIILGNIL